MDQLWKQVQIDSEIFYKCILSDFLEQVKKYPNDILKPLPRLSACHPWGCIQFCSELGFQMHLM